MSGLVVLGFPPRSALIADSLSPEDRGRGIATMDTISSGLSIFAPYIAGIVVELSGPNTGVRTLYGAMLVLYLATAVIHSRFLKESRSNRLYSYDGFFFPKVDYRSVWWNAHIVAGFTFLSEGAGGRHYPQLYGKWSGGESLLGGLRYRANWLIFIAVGTDLAL